MVILAAVRVIAILSCGLFTGFLFGDLIGTAFARPKLNASSFIQQQQIIHVHVVRILPALTLTAILSALGWLILVRARWGGAEFWLVVLAVGAMAFAFALTVIVNFPINAQLMTWNPAAPPGNFRDIWSPWETAHRIRTALWMTAFALEAVALGLFALPSK
jgi:uncharacterized membrane protein